MGMLTKGHKEEILNLMKKMDVRRVKGMEKGSQGNSKFDKEMKKLEWTIVEKKRGKSGRPKKGGRGHYSVC